MKRDKIKRLESAGWRVGTTQEFLGLSDEESSLLELKLALAKSVRVKRMAKHLSQVELARRLGSSQSRVAKMESAHASVSIDLLVRALLALGANRAELGRAVVRRLGAAA